MSSATARDLMTDRVLAARADWSLQELATFFTEHSISGAPVISEYGSVVGVVSLTDIARHDSEASPASEAEQEPPAYYLGEAATLREEEDLEALQRHPKTTVQDIMMPTLFTVEEEASIHEIADRMVRGHLHRLLVVRSDTKRDVVGIISAIDVLEWVRDRGNGASEQD